MLPACMKAETPLCQQSDCSYFSGLMFFAAVISNDKCALTKAVEELFEYIQQGEKNNQSDDHTTAVTKISAVFPTHTLLGPPLMYLGEPPK